MVVQKKVEVNTSHSQLQKFQQAVVDFHAVVKRPKVPLSRVGEMEEGKEEKEEESDEEKSDESESESDEDSMDDMMNTEEGDLKQAEGK